MKIRFIASGLTLPTGKDRHPVDVAIGSVIAEMRKSQKMTQLDLATLVDTHQSAIARVETGERRLDVIELLVLLSVLKVTPEEFFEVLRKRVSGVVRRPSKKSATAPPRPAAAKRKAR